MNTKESQLLKVKNKHRNINKFQIKLLNEIRKKGPNRFPWVIVDKFPMFTALEKPKQINMS